MSADVRPAAGAGTTGTRTRGEAQSKNSRVFDRADDLVWRLTVYDPVHDGWRFANLGGSLVLNSIGARAKLKSRSTVLEPCCGIGDTCCYLALRFGCRITGLDVNHHQIEAARHGLSGRHRTVAGRVSLQQADLRTWQPSRSFDLVYVLDSLMYLSDRSTIFAKLLQALHRDGLLALAEITAGPNLTDDFRAFMWESDGIVDVPPARSQERILREAGFSNLTTSDLTDLALDTCEKISAACVRHRATLDAVMPHRRITWEHENAQYLHAFRTGALRYTLMFADAGT